MNIPFIAASTTSSFEPNQLHDYPDPNIREATFKLIDCFYIFLRAKLRIVDPTNAKREKASTAAGAGVPARLIEATTRAAGPFGMVELKIRAFRVPSFDPPISQLTQIIPINKISIPPHAVRVKVLSMAH